MAGCNLQLSWHLVALKLCPPQAQQDSQCVENASQSGCFFLGVYAVNVSGLALYHLTQGWTSIVQLYNAMRA